MTPFIIPQVFLIKSLIRETYSRGAAGSGFLIIVDEISGFLVCDKVRTVKFSFKRLQKILTVLHCISMWL